MTDQVFYPYKFGAEILEIEFREVAIDGSAADLNKLINSSGNSIDASSIESDWSSISFDLSVRDANSLLASNLPAGIDRSNVSIFIVIRNRSTRMRFSIPLQNDTPQEWSGIVVCKRNDLFQDTDIYALAILNQDILEHDGYASRQGERIASTPKWKLYTDSKPPMPGGAIANEWKDFSTSDDPALKIRENCVWHLDLDKPREPRLLLNEAVPGLKTALEVQQYTGKVARVRDSLIHSILQPVLLQLCIFVLNKADGQEDLEELEDWHRDILLALAKNVSDEEPGETVAKEWLKRWRVGGGQPNVFAEVSMAVQEHIKLFDSSRYLVNSIEKELSSNE